MADCILDLRKVVGYRPLIQTGAGVIVVDTAGRILLQRRSDNGCWDYAGGSMELGEEVEETVCRKISCRSAGNRWSDGWQRETHKGGISNGISMARYGQLPAKGAF